MYELDREDDARSFRGGEDWGNQGYAADIPI